MSAIFYTVKKGGTTKKVKSSSFSELCSKVATSFDVNPNTILLRFEEPSGDKLTLDSDDTYEYMEQVLQDELSQKSNSKLVISLSSKNDEGLAAHQP